MNLDPQRDVVTTLDGKIPEWHIAFGGLQMRSSPQGNLSTSIPTGQCFTFTMMQPHLIPEGQIYVRDDDNRYVSRSVEIEVAGDISLNREVSCIPNYRPFPSAQVKITDAAFNGRTQTTRYSIIEKYPIYHHELDWLGLSGVATPYKFEQQRSIYLDPIFERLNAKIIANIQSDERVTEALFTNFLLMPTAQQIEIVEYTARRVGYTGSIYAMYHLEDDRVIWHLDDDTIYVMFVSASEALRVQGGYHKLILNSVPIEETAATSLAKMGATITAKPWHLPAKLLGGREQPVTYFADNVEIQTITLTSLVRYGGPKRGISAFLYEGE